MSWIYIFLIIAVAVCFGGIVFLWMLRFVFQGVASKILEDKIKSFLDISVQSLGEKKGEVEHILKEREEEFQKLVKNISEELRYHKQHVDTMEKERVQSFVRINEMFQHQAEATQTLKVSTEKLISILNNSRLRGQFGEQIAGDLLKKYGLIEGTHYVKNKAQDTTITRPDFTFFLPDHYKLNMDVKFPMENFLKLFNAQEHNKDAHEIDAYRNAFLKDIKAKIQEVTSRDYINPAEQTLDYVLIFIPNESIYSYINEQFPDLADFSMEKKVILVGPSQLFGFLNLLRQSFQNFYYEERTKDILKLFDQFTDRYVKFKDRFVKFGAQIEKLNEAYDDVTQKSFKMLETNVKKIEAHKKGTSVEEIEQSDAEDQEEDQKSLT